MNSRDSGKIENDGQGDGPADAIKHAYCIKSVLF